MKKKRKKKKFFSPAAESVSSFREEISVFRNDDDDDDGQRRKCATRHHPTVPHYLWTFFLAMTKSSVEIAFQSIWNNTRKNGAPRHPAWITTQLAHIENAGPVLSVRECHFLHHSLMQTMSCHASTCGSPSLSFDYEIVYAKRMASPTFFSRDGKEKPLGHWSRLGVNHRWPHHYIANRERLMDLKVNQKWKLLFV